MLIYGSGDVIRGERSCTDGKSNVRQMGYA